MMDPDYQPLAKNNRGPRSRKGKGAVALAHLEHGLASAGVVLPSEDAAGWARFHDEVVARYEPDGPIEGALASRVAETLWRLRRVARAEQQSVAIAQMRRDALVTDRKHAHPQSASPDPQLPDDDDAAIDALTRRRQAVGASLGIYAGALIADEVASRFRETLPVLLPDDRTLEMLVRYEAHLNRVLNHTLHELEALQDRRRGNPTPLARVDIN
jgi:hypothetical protein